MKISVPSYSTNQCVPCGIFVSPNDGITQFMAEITYLFISWNCNMTCGTILASMAFIKLDPMRSVDSSRLSIS